MSDARHHHFVPQAYLRRFADVPTRKGKLFVSDLLDRKQFSTLARNVAGSRDFNRIDADGHHPNALEDAYGRFESEITPAIDRIERTRQFEGHDRIVVLNLIGLLALRNPRMRRQWSEFQDRIHRMRIQAMTSTPERWESVGKQLRESGYEFDGSVTYSQIREFAHSGKYEVVTHRNSHIRLEIDGLDVLLPHLFGRSWHLYVVSDSSAEVVTSDHPVCLISTIPRPPGPFSALGYSMKNTAVVFPLTRALALWGTFECTEGTHGISAKAVANINSRIINLSDRQIYSRNERFQFDMNGKLYHGSKLFDHWEARSRGIE